LFHHSADSLRESTKCLRRDQPVETPLDYFALDLLLARHPTSKNSFRFELARQKNLTRSARVSWNQGFVQHTLIKLQPTEFAVDKISRTKITHTEEEGYRSAGGWLLHLRKPGSNGGLTVRNVRNDLGWELGVPSAKGPKPQASTPPWMATSLRPWFGAWCFWCCAVFYQKTTGERVQFFREVPVAPMSREPGDAPSCSSSFWTLAVMAGKVWESSAHTNPVAANPRATQLLRTQYLPPANLGIRHCVCRNIFVSRFEISTSHWRDPYPVKSGASRSSEH
jgi:hypothetical protein